MRKELIGIINITDAELSDIADMLHEHDNNMWNLTAQGGIDKLKSFTPGAFKSLGAQSDKSWNLKSKEPTCTAAEFLAKYDSNPLRFEL